MYIHIYIYIDREIYIYIHVYMYISRPVELKKVGLFVYISRSILYCRCFEVFPKSGLHRRECVLHIYRDRCMNIYAFRGHEIEISSTCGKLYELVGRTPDPRRLHLDTWGLKKLFSCGLRRYGVPLGRRKGSRFEDHWQFALFRRL